jgi:hypothetical protein
MNRQFDPNTMTLSEVPDRYQAEELALAIIGASQANPQVDNPGPPVVPEVVAPVVPVQQAAPIEPVRESVPVWGPDDWKRESASFRKSNFGGPQATPTQAVTPPAQDISSIQAQLNEMKALLQGRTQAAPPEPAPVGYRAELDPELSQVDPALAQRLEALSRNFETQLDRLNKTHSSELELIKKQNEEREAAVQSDRANSYQKTWEVSIAQLVPDLKDFLPGTPGGTALAQWANLVPEYAEAVNPTTCYNHSPHMLAMIISQFRPIYKGSVAASTRTPSIADLANPVLTGQAPAVVQQPVPAGPLLTPQQMATAWDDAQRFMAQGKEKQADALIEAYERTVQAMNKPQ